MGLNFGIHDCSKNTATMCMWNETIAGRGANEIISCLMKYIANIPMQVKTLTCYSDSSFGLNKNSQMICFWSHLITQKRFKRIDHKFLVRGHTYLPNDRDFSHIEKRRPVQRCSYQMTGRRLYAKLVDQNLLKC